LGVLPDYGNGRLGILDLAAKAARGEVDSSDRLATVATLGTALPTLVGRGYSFVTVSILLEQAPSTRAGTRSAESPTTTQPLTAVPKGSSD